MVPGVASCLPSLPPPVFGMLRLYDLDALCVRRGFVLNEVYSLYQRSVSVLLVLLVMPLLRVVLVVVVESVLVTPFLLASVWVLRVSVASHLVSLSPRTICVQSLVVAVLLLILMMMMLASVHLLLRCLFISP